MSFFERDIQKLGFGMMRLPKKDGAIDIEETKRMVDRFMDAGFTYFDTAWAYPGSEDAVRQALVKRYPRESFQLATKLAAWIKCKTRADAEKQFEDSLRQTGAGYFDNYLLHNLGEGRTHFFDDFDLWSFVREKKAEGKIRHIGFSFHSTPEELESILSAHPEMEFVQLQLNYADWENPAIQSRGVYETARRHNIPIVVMEPVKGGLLANPPESVLRVLRGAEPESSAASWGIRFAASLPGVLVVLSGMSSMEQMEDNLSYMKDFAGLGEAQRATVERAREELAKIPLIPCTNCNYCAKVCPMEIGVSGTFEAVNIYTLYGDLARAKSREGWQVGGHGRKHAVECIRCGQCEEACPQHIAIRNQLAAAAELFGQKKEA
ncbi:MAG: 4Fe-4S dicluster domain-containing protein [Ruminococcaceae bacterium]|nr:4Fe-4S dicluster domain-containing protein [Oscillospiraceae bacterium]